MLLIIVEKKPILSYLTILSYLNENILVNMLEEFTVKQKESVKKSTKKVVKKENIKTNTKKTNAELNNFLKGKTKMVQNNSNMPTSLFQKYNVKRGLRNEDGSGVLVGLTNIGEVRGYIKDEYESKPVPGQLRYRGIKVEDLIKGCSKENRYGFEETVYLILFGDLPNKDELDLFEELLDNHRIQSDEFIESIILSKPSRNIMNSLARDVLSSYSDDPRPEDRSIKNMISQCIKLIAVFPLFVLHAYKTKIHYHDRKTLNIHRIKTGLSTAELFLHMLRSDSKYTEMEAKILDLILILHAEHGGGNNSTFATRLVSSADTDIYSTISAAIGSLKGYKHGGANEQVLNMIEDIKANIKDYSDEKEVEEYLRKIVRKKAFDRTGLIYGMGHAVYTISDPREIILLAEAKKLAKVKNCMEEYNLYKIIRDRAPIILREEGKTGGKTICPNVDFFSGFVYQMLNIPAELYTPLFAVSRISGWCAHALEERISGKRIIRPAYKNVYGDEVYKSMEQRGK